MNKTVVVTGSSRGIGSAIAIKFSELGYNVVINYNSSEDMAINVLKKVRNNGSLAIAVKADVSDFFEAKSLIDNAVSEFGKIDVLINNAGIAYQGLFTEMSARDWDSIIGVNINSLFNCTQPAAVQMIKQHSGNIINISSMWGVTGASCEVAYSASKAAIIGFTKSLAKELGPSGVRVNCVAPGVIHTEMINDFSQSDIDALVAETPCMRIGTPEDVAESVAFLAKDSSSFITGQVIGVNGGFLI